MHIPFKRKKRPNEPRQPDTAYTFFWKSRRKQVVAENPTLPAPLVSREVGRQWKALGQQDRHVWDELAAQDKLRFQHEIASYKPPVEVGRWAFITVLTWTVGCSLSATSMTVQDSQATLFPKPIKDPYAPKPAKTSFQLFMNHNRESFTLLHMSLNEFRAEMSQIWKRLGDKDKEVWHEMAREDQRRYETELNAYKPPAYLSTNLFRATRRLDELKKAARADPDAPRQPVSAYSFFLSANRRDIQSRRPDLKHNDVMREVGLTWKALGDAERQPFVTQAEEDVERFQKEMELYTVKNRRQAAGQGAGTKTKAKKRCAGRVRNVLDEEDKYGSSSPVTAESFFKGTKRRKLVHPRRPQTAYNLMYMSKRAEILATYQVSHNECSALCGRLWRQMSEGEREPFHRMANEDKLRYQAELKEYRAKLDQENEATARETLGFRYFADAKRRENEGMTMSEVSAVWASMSEAHQVLWEELAADRQTSGDQMAEDLEEQRQLEENARTILAAREMRFSFDETSDAELPAHSDLASPSDEQYIGGDHYHPSASDHKPSYDDRKESLGFAHFMAAKKSEHSDWTRAMWMDEWVALPDAHRIVWEDHALEKAAERGDTLDADVLSEFLPAHDHSDTDTDADVDAFV